MMLMLADLIDCRKIIEEKSGKGHEAFITLLGEIEGGELKLESSNHCIPMQKHH